MPSLTLTRVNSQHIELYLVSDTGAPLEYYQFRPLAPKDQSRVCRSTGLRMGELVALLQQVKQPAVRGAPKPTVGPVPVPGTTGDTDDGPFSLVIRGLTQPAGGGVGITKDTPLEALTEALNCLDLPFAEPVIEFQGTRRACNLDVDYHYPADSDYIPRPEWVEMTAAGTRPIPAIYHLSHGGGAKLHYVERNGFTADELAAVAAIHWMNRDGRCRVEIKSQCRHPAYPRPDTGKSAGSVKVLGGNVDVGEMARWLGRGLTEDAIDEWLAEKGFRRGDKLDHIHCPIAPNLKTHAEPVYVGDHGIYCHACAARGLSRGGRRPGFVSYASLCGTVHPVIQTLVQHFAHWEHARIVLADRVKMPEALLRLGYRALLKLTHGPDDPRIAAITRAGKDMVRQRGRWTTADGSVTYSKDIAPMLGQLPAVQFVAGSGSERTVKTDAALVNRFQQQGDLTEYGYPHVTPLAGIRIYGHHLDYPDERILYAVPHSSFRIADGRFAPRYLKPDERHKEPWGVVERVFPGINREYVKLLLVQKGFIEGRAAQAPYIVVSGPSKAGKSTSVHLAASICGDICTDIVWTADTTRLRQSIYAANDRGTFVAVDEVFKNAERARVSPVQALDPVLNLTEDSTSHILYTGPVTLSRLPALVCTDIEVPAVVRNDRQLSRRFAYVRLRSQCDDWAKTIPKAGLQSAHGFRLLSDETAAACNTILSEVIDEFFIAPLEWKKAVEQAGWQLLCDSDDYENPDDQLRRLFTLVCEVASKGSNATSDERRYSRANGWVAVKQEETSELAELWGELVADDWTVSRRVREVDWTRLLGAKEPVEIDVGKYKASTVYLRFRTGSKTAPERINSAILDK